MTYSVTVNNCVYLNFFVLDQPDLLTSLSSSDPSDVSRKSDSFTKTLQRCHFCLNDEILEVPAKRTLLENVTGEQHCVLFMSQQSQQLHTLADFEVMNLDACLRSTGQLAQFANDCSKILQFPCYPTFPCRSFEGESVDIKFNGETGDKISFINLCVSTVKEFCQKMHDVEFVPVANILEAETLHLIKEGLEKLNYTCFIDVIPTAPEYRESADDCSIKMPVILFFEPRKYEGCEFPVVLIVMDKSNCLKEKTEDRSAFITALTRASLKLVIIVDDSSLRDDEKLKSALVADEDKRMEPGMGISEFGRLAKPVWLFVGRFPDKAGPFTREMNPPQMYLPDVDGISCYVGRHSRVLHIDDVYLESDLKKLTNFGIKIIHFGVKSIECEWHYFYYKASSACVANFQEKGTDVIEQVDSISTFEVEKHRIKRLLAFLKQQSGESDTEIPPLHFDFESQTLPKIDTDWSKWKSKAEELCRINQTTMAWKVYNRIILMLKRESNDKFQQGNFDGALKSTLETAKLLTNISKILLERADGIYDGKINPDVDFWGEIWNAFKITMIAMEYDPCCSCSYERMHDIVEKLKCRNYSSSNDSCDSRFDYRAEFSDFLNENVTVLSQKNNFLNGLEELYGSIEFYQKNSIDKSDSQLPLQSTISSKASILSRESLEFIQLCDVQYSDFHIMKRDLNLLRTQGTFLFDISVRLAMISSKYSLPTKSHEEVLYPALSKLEEVVSRIKELGSFIRHAELIIKWMKGHMSLPMFSTQS